MMVFSETDGILHLTKNETTVLSLHHEKLSNPLLEHHIRSFKVYGSMLSANFTMHSHIYSQTVTFKFLIMNKRLALLTVPAL